MMALVPLWASDAKLLALAAELAFNVTALTVAILFVVDPRLGELSVTGTKDPEADESSCHCTDETTPNCKFPAVVNNPPLEPS